MNIAVVCGLIILVLLVVMLLAGVPIAGLLIMVFSVMNAADMLHKDFSEPGEAKV